MDSKEPTCITCGQPAGEGPRLNRLENGSVCPTCRDRVLDLLPPIFPGGEGALDPARVAFGAGVEDPLLDPAPAGGRPQLVPVRGPRSTRSRSKRG